MTNQRRGGSPVRAMSICGGYRRGTDNERGNAAIELALLVPVLAMITFGVIDFARLFYAYMTVASAAHETATYLAQNSAASPTTTDLETVAAAESQSALGSVLTFTGATPNASLLKVNTLASGTANTNLFVRVQVTYNFQPLVKFPLKGPITVQAVADAPISRALT